MNKLSFGSSIFLVILFGTLLFGCAKYTQNQTALTLTPKMKKSMPNIDAMREEMVTTLQRALARLRENTGPLVGTGARLEFWGKDLFVTNFLHENAPAKKAGVRTSDKILKINGREFSRIEDVEKELKNGEAPGTKMLFTLRRNKELINIEVESTIFRKDVSVQAKNLKRRIKRESAIFLATASNALENLKKDIAEDRVRLDEEWNSLTTAVVALVRCAAWLEAVENEIDMLLYGQ